MKPERFGLLLPVLALAMLASPAQAGMGRSAGQEQGDGRTPPLTYAQVRQGVGFQPRLGAPLPPDLAFTDHRGRPVRLGECLGRRPIILVPVYYACPNACRVAMEHLVHSVGGLSASVGSDFDVLVFSIDPGETPAMAAAARQRALRAYRRPSAERGWHCWVGDAAAVRALADAIGLRYLRDPAHGQWAHPAGVVILTADGRPSHYFYGVDIPPAALGESLKDAAAGVLTGTPDATQEFCMALDPQASAPGRAAVLLLRGAALLTVALLAGYILAALRREKRDRQPSVENKGPGMLSAAPLLLGAASFVRAWEGLFWFEVAVAVGIVALIFLLIVYFAVRYRRRSEDDVPPLVVEPRWLEITWTVGTFAILMVFFFWGAWLYVRMKKPLSGTLEIHVIGKQWMWKIEHPEGVREINELHVPVGQPVKLIMASEDVIHSFFIPAFRIKQDLVPGSYVTQWFTATEPGVYHLFCAEYCGTEHSRMVGKVIAMPPADYQAWLAGVRPALTAAASGERLFRSLGCASCHGQRAPTLAGLYGSTVRLQDGSTRIADEQYLRESILSPNGQVVAGYPTIMPSYRGQVSEEQLFHLVAYIKSLSATANRPPPPATAPASMPAPATRPWSGQSPLQVPDYPPTERTPPFTPGSREP